MRKADNGVSEITDLSLYDSFPKLRSECKGAERPCPWVRCKEHMVWYSNITARVSSRKRKQRIFLRDNNNAIVVEKILGMEYNCSLDIQDTGAQTLNAIAYLFGMTKERVRQMIETRTGKVVGVIPRKLRKFASKYSLIDCV